MPRFGSPYLHLSIRDGQILNPCTSICTSDHRMRHPAITCRSTREEGLTTNTYSQGSGHSQTSIMSLVRPHKVTGEKS